MNGFPSAWIDGRTEIRPRWGRRVGGRQTSAHDATGTWERVAPHQWAWHVACKSGPHVFGAPLPAVLLPGLGPGGAGRGRLGRAAAGGQPGPAGFAHPGPHCRDGHHQPGPPRVFGEIGRAHV